jgi:hypothetical protein
MEKKTRNVVISVAVTLLVIAVLVATFSNTFGTSNGNDDTSDGDDYQRWCVGDYYTYSFIANHYVAGVLVSTEKANHTMAVISVNSTTVTIASTFDNGIRANDTITNDIDFKFYLLINNIQMVDKEVVQTSFGEKTLSHYNRSEPWPIYDLYVDDPSGLVFKQVTSTGIDIITLELIETNVEWVNDLANT